MSGAWSESESDGGGAGLPGGTGIVAVTAGVGGLAVAGTDYVAPDVAIASGKRLILDSSNSLTTTALQISGDANTGIGQIGGADTLGLVVGGVEVVRVAATGITLPSATRIKSGSVAVDTGYGLDLCDATYGNVKWGNASAKGGLSYSTSLVSIGAVTTSTDLMLVANNVEKARIKSAGDVVIGVGNTAQTSLATNATDGFLRLPGCAGPPTGAAVDGAAVLDTTNSKIYVRVGGAWKSVTVA